MPPQLTGQLATDRQDHSNPPEVRSLGRTLARWFEEITAWHKSFATNGPTEAINNLMMLTAMRDSL